MVGLGTTDTYILLEPNFNTMAHFYDFLNKNNNKKIKICDEIFFKKNKLSITSRGRRGSALDTTCNKFKGDINSIKDVYFLRGTTFDRGYFKRLYTDVNIRKNIENADVVIYDDNAIFSNDKEPEMYRTFLLNNERYCYSTANPPSFIMSANFASLSNIIARSGNIFNVTDAPIASAISSNGGPFSNARVSTTSFYRFHENEYLDYVRSANKPYLDAKEFFSSRSSSSRQDNMTYEDFISIASQLMSSDNNIKMTACETLIQYNTQKYFLNQFFLLFMTSFQEYAPFSASKKFNLFKKSYIDPLYVLGGRLINPQDANIKTDESHQLAVYDILINSVKSWIHFVSSERASATISLTRENMAHITKFIYSPEFFDILATRTEHNLQFNSIDLRSGQIKAASQPKSTGLKIKVNPHSVMWTLDHEFLVNPNFYTGSFDQNVSYYKEHTTSTDTPSSNDGLAPGVSIAQEFGI